MVSLAFALGATRLATGRLMRGRVSCLMEADGAIVAAVCVFAAGAGGASETISTCMLIAAGVSMAGWVERTA